MNIQKNILTVAPFLADEFVDIDEPTFDNSTYEKLLQDNQQRLGLFGKYLVGLLHDSWVIDIKQTDNLFSVLLNDFSTHVFADAIIDKKKLTIEHDKLVFPIQLDFKTTHKVTYNEVDDDGNLTEIKPIKLDEYLGEQIISVDNDKIEFAFTFWHSEKKKPGTRLVLLITAAEISVSEKQDLAWQQIFGSDFDNYYQYFKQQFNSRRYVSDLGNCLQLIDEYDANF
jgi:hypothetical protein